MVYRGHGSRNEEQCVSRDATLQPAAAWKILFENETVPSELKEARYLTGRVLKQAYRRCVFATHPDRAEVLGMDRAVLENELVRVNRAYRVLSAHVVQGPVDTALWRHRPVQTATRAPTAEPLARTGAKSAREIPYRRLPLGRFMYYSGLISWNVLVDALAWQAEHRPLFGQLAVELGYLNRGELDGLVGQEAGDVRIGERAMASGLLSLEAIRAVMAHQRAHQEPLGEFFVKRGYFSRSELGQLLASHRRHNAQFAKAA